MLSRSITPAPLLAMRFRSHHKVIVLVTARLIRAEGRADPAWDAPCPGSVTLPSLCRQVREAGVYRVDYLLAPVFVSDALAQLVANAEDVFPQIAGRLVGRQ